MARRDLTGAVDFAQLERLAGGDMGVVEEVLDVFPEQAALWLRLLDPAGSAELWRDGAHTMKGSALGIGAAALGDACAAAEADWSAGIGRKTSRLDQLRDALDAALADIAAYRHELALRSLKAPPS